MQLPSTPIFARKAEEIILFSPPDGAQIPETVEERGTPNAPERTLTNVRSTVLRISWPELLSPSMPAVLILPGGGYGKLVIDKEGHDIARWFNTHGFVSAVLKYRLPRAEMYAEDIPWQVQDATKAIRLLRVNAHEWNIDPAKVGVFGSSAGGHLASVLATHYDRGNKDAKDKLQQQSCRPDFQILLYPVITFTRESIIHVGSRRNLLGPTPNLERLHSYSSNERVTSDTPPAFIVHAIDDKIVNAEHSRLYANALHNNNVPCDYLEIPAGGHGFGLGVCRGDALLWPPRCLSWLMNLIGQESS